jgi:hypothetical protein
MNRGLAVLVAAIFVVGHSSISAAEGGDDYASCMHDAVQTRAECLRWASENHAADAVCTPQYNQDAQECANDYRH